MNDSGKFPTADVTALVCAILIGVGFTMMPWWGAGGATGFEVMFVNENCNPFMVTTWALIPLAALVALFAALWGLFNTPTRRFIPVIICLAGVVALTVYGSYFVQYSSGFTPSGEGFWVALAGAVGLVAQLFIPRFYEPVVSRSARESMAIAAGEQWMSSGRNVIMNNLPAYGYLVVMSLFVVLPLLIIISQSLMTNQDVNRWPPQIIPTAPTLNNYCTVFTQQDLKLGIWLRNSLFAATCYMLAVMVLCAPAAYAFARLRFPGRNIIFALLLLTIMIPSQVTLIPNYLLMRDLKFIDTFHALIWPGAANVFAVFLLRQFFLQIPQELEEAAILDGATYWGRFFRIVLPLSTNALMALGILTFLGHYNDLLWPFLVLNSNEVRTLPVGLQILNSSYAGQYRPMVLSGAVAATVPIVIVYVLFQRQIIKGVTMTGMGGR